MTEPPASTMEQNSQIVEEKKPPVLKPSSYEYLIPETRKLIKKVVTITLIVLSFCTGELQTRISHA